MTQYIVNGIEFKVGDKVRVERKIKSHTTDGMGEAGRWNNSWVDEMDYSIGKEFTIDSITSSGARLKGDSLGYPLTALTNLSVPLRKLKLPLAVTRATGAQVVLVAAADGNVKMVYPNTGSIIEYSEQEVLLRLDAGTWKVTGAAADSQQVEDAKAALRDAKDALAAAEEVLANAEAANKPYLA